MAALAPFIEMTLHEASVETVELLSQILAAMLVQPDTVTNPEITGFAPVPKAPNFIGFAAVPLLPMVILP